MKTKNSSACFPVILMVALAGGMSAEEPLLRQAPTHQQLVVALRKSQQNDPMMHLAPAKGEDPAVANRPQSLLSRSDIICYRGLATIIPKRAVIQVPKNCEDRMKMQPGAKFVSWADFYVANRGWITTIEVKLTQAEGNSALAEETQVSMSKSANLIVATYRGGPISVLPLKPAAEPVKQ